MYEEEKRLQKSANTEGIVPQQPSGAQITEGLLAANDIRLEKSQAHQIDRIRKFHLNFSKIRQACKSLIREAIVQDQPMHKVEARIFFIRWSILERSGKSSSLERSKTLLSEAKQHVALAQRTCERYPGQTQGMLRDISDVDIMLKDTPFYISVDNKEKRQVYAAIAREFTSTGHWYTCLNSHPFTVGECGMPMQTSVYLPTVRGFRRRAKPPTSGRSDTCPRL